MPDEPLSTAIDSVGQEIAVGYEVVDDAGQNGVGIVTKIGSGQIQADWTSHRFDGVVRGWIGLRWVRRVATSEQIATRSKKRDAR